VDPNQIEVTVKDDTVTIRGSRQIDELKQARSYLRQERGPALLSGRLPCRSM